MILQKTDKTPEGIELLDLMAIWKSLDADGELSAVAAFRRLLKALRIKASSR